MSRPTSLKGIADHSNIWPRMLLARLGLKIGQPTFSVAEKLLQASWHCVSRASAILADLRPPHTQFGFDYAVSTGQPVRLFQ